MKYIKPFQTDAVRSGMTKRREAVQKYGDKHFGRSNKEMRRLGRFYVVGVDEVGRGPLAGPVTVCVVVCEENLYKKLKRDKKLPKAGKDSKKLSPESREHYAKYLQTLLQKNRIDYIGVSYSYVVTHVSNTVIDTKGISFAIRKAIANGLRKLQLDPAKCDVRLDGSLKAPAEFTKQKTIIKGDEREKIIAWASILAKVSRDSLMRRMSKKFPQYGFEIHKGYGTAKHRKTILKYGISAVHRTSFCKFVLPCK